MTHSQGLLVKLFALGFYRGLDGNFLVVGEELEVIDEDVGCILQGGLRRDGTVCDNLQVQLLVVRLLFHAVVFHGPVDFTDGRVDSVHGQGADGRVLVAEFLCGNKAAALGDGQGDGNLYGGLQRADVQLGIQHLERRQSFGDVLSGKLLLAADCDIRHLGVYSVHHPTEAYLLQVQDDVLHSLNHAGDGLELVLNTRDLDLRDSETFERVEKDATEGVTDGLSVARLKRPELETAHGLGAFEHDHLVRFLKC